MLKKDTDACKDEKKWNKLKRFGGDQIADIKNRKRWNTSKMGRITDQKRELGESEKNDIKKDNRNT